MISAKPVISHLGFSVDSPLRAIQEVREKIVNSTSPLKEANGIVFKVAGLEKTFTDVATAIHIAQHIVLTYIQNESYDKELAWNEAVKKDEAVRKALPWAFEKAEATTKNGETDLSTVEGIDVQVAVNKNGSIRKGGKQILCAELYKKYVLETSTPVTSKQFTTILEKQLGLSRSCSSTYSYNVKKALGGAFAV